MKAEKKKEKFVFRSATLADISDMVNLELAVWGENAANREQLISRINVFSAGNIIALLDKKVVGYLSLENVDNMNIQPDFSWSEITDNGTVAKSHRPQGQYMYGVNLSIHHSMSGQNLGLGLMLQAWRLMILTNKRGVFLGSRIPGFRNYKKHHPEVTAEEYIRLKRNGKLRDYELKLYAEDGLLALRVLPNYFPDPPSLDYGVLLYRKNPVYNWPFRKLWAWLISLVPISVRSKLAIAKDKK